MFYYCGVLVKTRTKKSIPNGHSNTSGTPACSGIFLPTVAVPQRLQVMLDGGHSASEASSKMKLMQAAPKPEEPGNKLCNQTYIFHCKAHWFHLESCPAAHIVSGVCINSPLHTPVDMIRLEEVLSNPIWKPAPACGREGGLDNLERSLPTQTIAWSLFRQLASRTFLSYPVLLLQ